MEIKDLVQQYTEAKAAEDTATAERKRLALLVAQKLGYPEDGSRTHTLEGGVKVTVKGVINRKVDWVLFDAVCLQHPGQAAPVVRKPSLDKQGWKWTRENRPEFWGRLADAVTETPGAVSVTVKGVYDGV